MDSLLLVARLLLALVFAIAGVAKLSDREGSRRAIAGFGVPSALAAPRGLVLPLAAYDATCRGPTHRADASIHRSAWKKNSRKFATPSNAQVSPNVS
jgi:hypothetical protein